MVSTKDRIMEICGDIIKSYRIQVAPNGRISRDGAFVNVEGILDDFTMDTATVRDNKNGITGETLEIGLRRSLQLLQEEAEARLLEAVVYDPSKSELGTQALRNWFESLTGAAPTGLELAICQHFLWQVKRKAARLDVTWHLMPIFTGPQSVGKSTALDRLLAPINQMVISGQSVDYITDPHNFKALGENLVVFLDELAHAAKTNVEKLKQIVTARDLTYRIIYRQQNGYAAQRCTFIGTSNKDIQELIVDSTGMRRFYQIKCAAATNDIERKSRWKLMNEIDTTLIWQSIDDKRNVPYIDEHQEELRIVQEALRAPNLIEQFVSERGLDHGSCQTSGKTLYMQYQNFTKEAGYKMQHTRKNFYRGMEELGYKKMTDSKGSIFFFTTAAAAKQIEVIKRISQ